jgi:hypothetical protein
MPLEVGVILSVEFGVILLNLVIVGSLIGYSSYVISLPSSIVT